MDNMKDEIELEVVSVTRKLVSMKRADVGDEVFNKTLQAIENNRDHIMREYDYGLFEDVEESEDVCMSYATLKK